MTMETQETIDTMAQDIQLLERRIEKLEKVVAMALQNESAEIDYGAPYHSNEQCREHKCSYYQHYLAYGPPTLTHEGFHAGEKAAEAHISKCKGYFEPTMFSAGGMCSLCTDWEQRLRA